MKTSKDVRLNVRIPTKLMESFRNYAERSGWACQIRFALSC